MMDAEKVYVDRCMPERPLRATRWERCARSEPLPRGDALVVFQVPLHCHVPLRDYLQHSVQIPYDLMWSAREGDTWALHVGITESSVWRAESVRHLPPQPSAASTPPPGGSLIAGEFYDFFDAADDQQHSVPPANCNEEKMVEHLRCLLRHSVRESNGSVDGVPYYCNALRASVRFHDSSSDGGERFKQLIAQSFWRWWGGDVVSLSADCLTLTLKVPNNDVQELAAVQNLYGRFRMRRFVRQTKPWVNRFAYVKALEDLSDDDDDDESSCASSCSGSGSSIMRRLDAQMNLLMGGTLGEERELSELHSSV